MDDSDLRRQLSEARKNIRVIAEELRETNLGLIALTIELDNKSQALHTAEKKYRSIFENATEGIFRSTPGSRYITVNPAMARILGYASPDELMESITNIDSQLYVDMRYLEIFKRHLDDHGQTRGFEFRVRRKDGSIIWISKSANAARNKSGELLYYEGTIVDITERKRAEEALQKAHDKLEMRVKERTADLAQTNRALEAEITERKRAEEALQKAHDELEMRVKERTADLAQTNQALEVEIAERKRAEERIQQLAQYDPLTGLPNRRLFQDRLQQALYSSERRHGLVALMFLDLDNFKFINDTLGHKAGDQVLIEAARRLTTCTRKNDTVARLGGDEFTIIATDLKDVQTIEILVQRIKESFARPLHLDGQEVFITGSIGVAIYPLDGQEPDILLKHADLAMYQAKEQGKNDHCFFTQELNVRASNRSLMQQNLRRALERDEFELYYQPKINLATGKISGVEALIRWNAPDTGIVLPSQFIPLAEETGLITPIGHWVFQKALEKIKSWQTLATEPIPIVINLSAKQFNHRAIVKTIEQLLETFQISPELLELDLTEAAIMQEVDKSIKILSELKRLGVRLALDDFGTGFFSLNALRRLPIDTLKIDTIFVGGVPYDLNNLAICRAIIALAHSMNLKVLAEGVETEEQYKFLCEEGCDEGQGFYFFAPVPEKDLLDFIENYSTNLVRLPMEKTLGYQKLRHGN